MLLLATKVWEQRKLGEMITERKILRFDSREFPLSSFIKNEGVVPKSSRYDRSFLVKSNSKKYKETRLGDFIYSSNNLDTGSIGLNNYGNAVISPVYSIFTSKDTENLETSFINLLFKKNFYKNKMLRFRQGVTYGQWKIKENDFLNLKVYISNSVEIEKIIAIFSKISQCITLYAKKSSCLDSCIAYFIRILYDDPQFFKQKSVQNSVIKSFKLDDILIKNNAKNKDLSVLNVESISNKKGFISQKEQFDNYQVASKDLSNYYVIHPKDFAYNPSRINVGSIAYKSPNDVKGIVSPLYVSFKCKNDIVLDKYLWHWFKSTNFEHQRVRLSEGGVRDILSFNQLSKMKISIPSFEIQRQTINLLEILIQYKEEVDLKLNNLKLIKNTLLQSMFL